MSPIAAPFLLAFAIACGRSEPAPAVPSPEPEPSPAPSVPEGGDAVALRVLAPSPLALEREVRAAGIAEALAPLVPASLPDTRVAEPDRAAVRSGVVLAYTVLGGSTLPKDAFLARLLALREGMAAIGTGQGLLATLDTFTEQVRNDAASREDFLVELDGVASYMVPEEGWGPHDRTGPLVQAGAWLAGTHLVARAVVASGDAAAPSRLLRRPEVPAYFLRYLSDEGRGKAGPLTDVVIATLTRLHEVGAKAELGLDDARAVEEATGRLLAEI